MAKVDDKRCLCLATKEEHDGPPKRETSHPYKLHYIKFGTHQLLALERELSLYIPVDIVKQTIGSAAYQELFYYKSLYNIDLLSLEESDVKTLEKKYRSHGNISYKDLIKLDDFLSFCKSFTSTDLSNSVITELALNSTGQHYFCHHCGQWKGSTGTLTSSLDLIPSDSGDVLDLNLVNTKCSVGYLDVGNTKLKSFKLGDDIFICIKDFVKNQILKLTEIQRGMKELKIKPITAPTEVLEQLCEDEVQSYNTLWLTVLSCHKIVKLLKKRGRKDATDLKFLPNLRKGIYSFNTVAELYNVSIEQTASPLAVDSVTLELIEVDHNTFKCVHQENEQFYIVYKTKKRKPKQLHKDCHGCCIELKPKTAVKKQNHVDPILPHSNESNSQESREGFQPQTECTTYQGMKTEKKQTLNYSELNDDKQDDSNESEKSYDTVDDIYSALALVPGDYHVVDYPKFCVLLNTARDGNSSPDGIPMDIESEDQYATKMIEEEMQFQNGYLNTLFDSADVNNNIHGEAMEMCGIDEDCNETFVQTSEYNIDSGELLTGVNVQSSVLQSESRIKSDGNTLYENDEKSLDSINESEATILYENDEESSDSINESEATILYENDEESSDSINESEATIPFIEDSVGEEEVPDIVTEKHEIPVDTDTVKQGELNCNSDSIRHSDREDTSKTYITPFKFDIQCDKTMPVLKKEKFKVCQKRENNSDCVDISKTKVDKSDKTESKKLSNIKRTIDSASDVKISIGKKLQHKLKRKVKRKNSSSPHRMTRVQRKNKSRNDNEDYSGDTEVESVQSEDRFSIDIYKVKDGTKIIVKNWEKYEGYTCKCRVKTSEIKKVVLTKDEKADIKDDGSQVFEPEDTRIDKKLVNANLKGDGSSSLETGDTRINKDQIKANLEDDLNSVFEPRDTRKNKNQVKAHSKDGEPKDNRSNKKQDKNRLHVSKQNYEESKVLNDDNDKETNYNEGKGISVMREVNTDTSNLICHTNILCSSDCYVKILQMPWLDKLV